MTLPSPFVVEPGLIAPAPQRAEQRRDPVPIGALIRGTLVTGACVAGALAVAMATLPPLETPGYVVEAFYDAGLRDDWPAAWDLVCQPTREAVGDFATFAEDMTFVNDNYLTPATRGLDIVAGDMRSISGPAGPALSVAVGVASNDGKWTYRGELLVAQEDGAFRVCPVQAST